jgi:hypothetical protein
VANAEWHFLGHNLGRRCYVPSTLDTVADAGPDGAGLYTIHTALPPTRFVIGRAFGLRLDGVNYDYLIRRRWSATREEADYGLSVALLAIGAEFAYDSARLDDALKH